MYIDNAETLIKFLKTHFSLYILSNDVFDQKIIEYICVEVKEIIDNKSSV
jgi:hypothetical protein